jgi:hypothetical protein
LEQRLVQLRGQYQEVLDLALQPERLVEPRLVFCMDSSDREIWIPRSSVMLRIASVKRGISRLAGNRKMNFGM